MAATALHEVVGLGFSEYTRGCPEAIVYRGIQQTRYALNFGWISEVWLPPRSILSLRREPSENPGLELNYCGPNSKSTNVFAIGCGRGRGLSGVGCPAALKSAVSVKT